MLDITKILHAVKDVIDIIAIVYMIWGLFRALIRITKNEIQRGNDSRQIVIRDNIRVFLGTYILLGLEILILADIIGTIINPELEELITLITIVVVRTIISFFLQRDVHETIEHVEKEQSALSDSQNTPVEKSPKS